MVVSFNKILIPVDFSVNTETAVNKAIGLAVAEEVVIHLLHVVRPGRKAVNSFRVWTVERDLYELKCKLEQNNPNVQVKTHVLRGRSIQETIIDCSAMLSPDLVILGKQNNHRRWFFSRQISPGLIAKKSNCPVLTAKPGSIDVRTRVIVLPIGNFLPERKLEWAVVLAKKFKAQVHLLAMGERAGQKDGPLSQVFLRAYHHLRENLHHPIEYNFVGRHHAVEAALSYAELIMADMIVVNPNAESKVAGITGSQHLSDLLKRDSKIQVLDIEPYKIN